jgi:hypothetical protein
MTNHELEELYGQAFAYSDHKQGERLAYTASETGARCTGTILWVCAPGQVVAGGRHHPVRYIVLRDGQGGFPDVVEQNEIVES